MFSFKFLWLAAFLSLLVGSTIGAPGERTTTPSSDREKREIETTGLFPFPRIGRTSPFSWLLPGIEYGGKRDQLIPFPRIGKSEPKRNGASGGGGLWFGPRLGRLSKRMDMTPSSYHQDSNSLETSGLKDLNDFDDYSEPRQ